MDQGTSQWVAVKRHDSVVSPLTTIQAQAQNVVQCIDDLKLR